MNLEQIHYDILRLKLRKAEIVFEKIDAVRSQHYEKAADIRDKERKIIDELAIVQAKLMHHDASLELNQGNFRTKLDIRNLLIELNPVDHDFALKCLEDTEHVIAALRQDRQTLLSDKNHEAAEPIIIAINEKLKLRNKIQDYLLRTRKI